MMIKRKNQLREDGIEKSIPCDHHLSSIKKPLDDKQWS